MERPWLRLYLSSVNCWADSGKLRTWWRWQQLKYLRQEEKALTCPRSFCNVHFLSSLISNCSFLVTLFKMVCSGVIQKINPETWSIHTVPASATSLVLWAYFVFLDQQGGAGHPNEVYKSRFSCCSLLFERTARNIFYQTFSVTLCPVSGALEVSFMSEAYWKYVLQFSVFPVKQMREVGRFCSSFGQSEANCFALLPVLTLR